MLNLSEQYLQCPYCGEQISMLVDASMLADNTQVVDFIEDCEVCCRPITVQISRLDNESYSITATTENSC